MQLRMAVLLRRERRKRAEGRTRRTIAGIEQTSRRETSALSLGKQGSTSRTTGGGKHTDMQRRPCSAMGRGLVWVSSRAKRDYDEGVPSGLACSVWSRPPRLAHPIPSHTPRSACDLCSVADAASGAYGGDCFGERLPAIGLCWDGPDEC
jgi:hypothetical protein